MTSKHPAMDDGRPSEILPTNSPYDLGGSAILPTVWPDLPGNTATTAATEPCGKVGPYDLLGILGSGGMGDVYKARHRTLGRVVALKLIRPELITPELTARFRREGRVAAALSHPNTVLVYDAGEDAGVFYLAMELLPGHNLAKYLSQHHPIPVAEVCGYVMQVAQVLQHLHERALSIGM